MLAREGRRWGFWWRRGCQMAFGAGRGGGWTGGRGRFGPAGPTGRRVVGRPLGRMPFRGASPRLVAALAEIAAARGVEECALVTQRAANGLFPGLKPTLRLGTGP